MAKANRSFIPSIPPAMTLAEANTLATTLSYGADETGAVVKITDFGGSRSVLCEWNGTAWVEQSDYASKASANTFSEAQTINNNLTVVGEVRVQSNDNALIDIRADNDNNTVNDAYMRLVEGGAIRGLFGYGGSLNGIVIFSGSASAPPDSPHIFIAVDGDVGVGTTAPGSKLHLQESGAALSQRFTQYRTSEFGIGFEAQRARGTSTTPAAVVSGDDLFTITAFGHDGTDFATPAGLIRFEVDGAPGSNVMPGKITFHTNPGGLSVFERIAIDSDGNLGIGETEPVGLFDSGAKTLYLASPLHTELVLDHTDGGTGSHIGAITFARNKDPLAVIQGGHDGAIDSAYITFRTQATGGVLTERMRITSSGRIGIGTTSPDGALHIVDSPTQTTALIIDNTIGATNDESKVEFRHNNNEQAYIKTILNAGWLTDLVFAVATGQGTGLSEVMRLKSGGNIGIGTSSPGARLSVDGGAILLGIDRYLNFNSAVGSTGYGIRDNAGIIQYKNSGGDWADFPTSAPSFTFGGVAPKSTSLVDYPKIVMPDSGVVTVNVTNETELENALKQADEHVRITASGVITMTDRIPFPDNTGTIKKRYFDNVTVDASGYAGKVFTFSNAGGYIFASVDGDPRNGLTIQGANQASSPNDGSIQVANFTAVRQQLTFSGIVFKDSLMTGLQVFSNKASPVLVQDCIGYNFNPGSVIGGTNAPDFILASGFNSDSSPSGSITSNVTIVRCAANTARGDDGIDFFRGRNNIAIDCVIIDAGVGHTGDGFAFKMGNGGDSPNDSGNNVLRGCIAVTPRTSAFDHNGVPNDCYLEYCTAVGAGVTHFDGGSNLVVTNSISSTNDNAALATGSERNSWDIDATEGFVNTATGDLSLVAGSDYAKVSRGQPAGAADVAIQLYMDMFSLIG